MERNKGKDSEGREPKGVLMEEVRSKSRAEEKGGGE